MNVCSCYLEVMCVWVRACGVAREMTIMMMLMMIKMMMMMPDVMRRAKHSRIERERERWTHILKNHKQLAREYNETFLSFYISWIQKIQK